MISFSVGILQVLSCIGLGSALLKIFRLEKEFPECERLLLAFALGMGLTGWLVFFIGISGYLFQAVLWGALGLGLAGLLVSPPRLAIEKFKANDDKRVCAVIVFLLLFSLLLDFAEALTPSGDADSLAYHFALPKTFLELARIEFVPRALDGATALLVHMTYVPPLALGGERAMLLWTLFSGWIGVYAVYVLSRRHLNQIWSLVVALAFATTPAVVYGAGSGQVEIRNMIFVIAALIALTHGYGNASRRIIFIVGLLAGFFAGGKYLGLIFVICCGLAVLWERRTLTDGFVYGLGVLLAGFQWYMWNAVHIGDPLFPMFYEWLGDKSNPMWTNENQLWLKQVFIPNYKSVPNNLFWYFALPFKAILDGEKAFESARTGLGPVIWVVLPFALAGIWRFRSSIKSSPLLTYGLVILVFYTLWFFSQSPQRIRFLLPVYPLLLLAGCVAAIRFADAEWTKRPLIAGMAVCILIQLGGHGLYSHKFILYLFSLETREQFLARTISGYGAAPWINANLGKQDKLFIQDRNYLYYLDVPYYYAHPSMQALVDLLPSSSNVTDFVKQIRKLEITHLLVQTDAGSMTEARRFSEMASQKECLTLEKTFQINTYASRTLPTLKSAKVEKRLYRFDSANCQLLSS